MKKDRIRILICVLVLSLLAAAFSGFGKKSAESGAAKNKETEAAATLPSVWKVSHIRIITDPDEVESIPSGRRESTTAAELTSEEETGSGSEDPETSSGEEAPSGSAEETQESAAETLPEQTTEAVPETLPPETTAEPTSEPTPETTTEPEPYFAEITEDNLDEYCAYLIRKNNLNSPWAVYDYVRHAFTYKLKDRLGSERAMACRMFNDGCGPCYDYDCAAAVLLRAIGCRCYLVHGYNANGSEHDWLIAELGANEWRHLDPYRGGWSESFGLFGLTDEQLLACEELYGLTYNWDRSVFTSESPTGTGPGYTGG